jgi:1-deoxy-D-xylulose-5-phosphate synthase
MMYDAPFLFSCSFQFNGVILASLDNNTRDQLNRYQETKQKRSLNFTGNKPSTPVLDTINHPIHMKNLSVQVRKLNQVVFIVVWLVASR